MIHYLHIYSSDVIAQTQIHFFEAVFLTQRITYQFSFLASGAPSFHCPLEAVWPWPAPISSFPGPPWLAQAAFGPGRSPFQASSAQADQSPRLSGVGLFKNRNAQQPHFMKL